MASQIVRLLPDTIVAIQHHSDIPRAQAFGSRDLETKMTSDGNGWPAVAVLLDPLTHCPELRSPYVDDFYALLLTCGDATSAAALPQALPQPVVVQQLRLTEAALQELPDLNGHARLDIAAGVNAAIEAAPIVRQLRRRPATSAAEIVALSEAARLQQGLAPDLARLNRKLAQYRALPRRSDLEAAVMRLGLQAELGSSLKLDLAGSTLVPRLEGKTRHIGLAGLWRATMNQLSCLQHVAEMVHDAQITGENWLKVASLPYLHRVLMANLPACEHAGHLRQTEIEVRSAYDGRKRRLTATDTDVSDGLEAFTSAYDAALWQGIHPLLRAGLAHIAFSCVDPFACGNGRFARHLVQGILMEAGLPGLPLEAIVSWNRATYHRHVDNAVSSGDPTAFVQFLLKACDRAISLARLMIEALASEYDATLAAMVAARNDRHLSTVAAEFAVSMLLGPDPQAARRTIHAMELSWKIDASRRFDTVNVAGLGFTLDGYDSDEAWSSPIARQLLAAPSAGI